MVERALCPELFHEQAAPLAISNLGCVGPRDAVAKISGKRQVRGVIPNPTGDIVVVGHNVFRRILLCHYAAGTVVGTRSLVGTTPRAIELKQLALNKRATERVITVDCRVLDVASYRGVSA